MGEAIAHQPSARTTAARYSEAESTGLRSRNERSGGGTNATITAGGNDASSDLPIHIHLLAREIGGGTGPRRPIYSHPQNGQQKRTNPVIGSEHQGFCKTDTAISPTGFPVASDVIKLATEHSFYSRLPPKLTKRWRMDSAILRHHTRKVSALAFWPDKEKQLLVSGDKRGRVAVLDFNSSGHCRNLYENVHSLLIRDIVFTDKDSRAGSSCCVTASADGCARLLNLEIGTYETIFDLNSISNSLPLIGTATQQLLSRSWCSLCSLTMRGHPGMILTGDNIGYVHGIDLRCPLGSNLISSWYCHTSKVLSLQAHPMRDNIVLSSSSDHSASIFDLRRMERSSIAFDQTDLVRPLVALNHQGRLLGASFSPITGKYLVTACQDGPAIISIWDNATKNLIQCATGSEGPAASRSLEFARSLERCELESPHLPRVGCNLTSAPEFDPKDWAERIFAIGSCCPNGRNGVTINPVHLVDAGKATIEATLLDKSLPMHVAINKFHPYLDALASASSRHLYLWRPSSLESTPTGTYVVRTKKNEAVQR